MTKPIYKRAVPYKEDALNLPVADVDAAVPFYEQTFDFRVVARTGEPHKRAVLARDEIQIGLAENGGDPTQEGCFFEVSDVDAALAEIKSKHGNVSEPDTQKIKGQTFKAFFVVAPDGLCYMIAQPQPD
ncbi:MAG TPA: VOC family protein [Pyrinomonadaceae bacterium]|nr:VOC family protein [Pyrinomonadaceae bacterium]